MKTSVEKILTIGITLAIACAMAIAFLSIRQFGRFRDASASISHTNQVLLNTQTVLAASINYELKVEDFLLTGNSTLLDSLWKSASLLHTTIAELKSLTADNPLQQRRIDSLLYY